MYVCPTIAARIAGIRWTLIWDLMTYPDAPSSKYAFTKCSSEWIVRKTTLADGAGLA